MDRNVLDVLYPIVDAALAVRARCMEPDISQDKVADELLRAREWLIYLLVPVKTVLSTREDSQNLWRATIYWLDEVFTRTSVLCEKWENNTLELDLLLARTRASAFWELVEQRNAAQPQVARLCQWCIQMGFVGQLDDETTVREVGAWLLVARETANTASRGPRDAPPTPEVPACPSLLGDRWLRWTESLTIALPLLWLGIAVVFLSCHLGN